MNDHELKTVYLESTSMVFARMKDKAQIVKTRIAVDYSAHWGSKWIGAEREELEAWLREKLRRMIRSHEIDGYGLHHTVGRFDIILLLEKRKYRFMLSLSGVSDAHVKVV